MGIRRGHIDDWVIVGGGIHGTCAARALVAAGAEVAIIDPAPRLLDRWRSRAAAVSMRWLRSPASHHLDRAPVSLHHFVHGENDPGALRLAGPFRRPNLEAFMRHSSRVIADWGLERRLVKSVVTSIRQEGGLHRVECASAEPRLARRVLLAVGSNRLRRPGWAATLADRGAPIRHVFEAGGDPVEDVIGGGISAVQVALHASTKDGARVRLWHRAPLRVSEFDFAWSWAKHRFMGTWQDLGPRGRQDFLQRTPRRGSVPPGLERRLSSAVSSGRIQLMGPVGRVGWDGGSAQLSLEGAGSRYPSAGVVLATGVEQQSAPAVAEHVGLATELPTSAGFPLLGDDMDWGMGIHVTGPLARLRLGPVAPTIVGARWATSKLPGVRLQPV